LSIGKIDVGPFLENFSRKSTPKMRKNFKQQQLLVGDVKMETQTMFHANGDINIYPCGWENQQVTSGGRREPRGKMLIEEDGTSHFKAYRQNTGRRRELLFTTRHGRVEMTRPLYVNDRKYPRRRLDMEHVYVTFKFPKNLGLALTKAIYAEEADEVMAYFKTRKEETVWQQD
jgi:hypothetical protein